MDKMKIGHPIATIPKTVRDYRNITEPLKDLEVNKIVLGKALSAAQLSTCLKVLVEEGRINSICNLSREELGKLSYDQLALAAEGGLLATQDAPVTVAVEYAKKQDDKNYQYFDVATIRIPVEGGKFPNNQARVALIYPSERQTEEPLLSALHFPETETHRTPRQDEARRRQRARDWSGNPNPPDHMIMQIGNQIVKKQPGKSLRDSKR